MDDYNDYVTAINKIYDYISKVKAGWDNQDNNANIEKLDDYKNLVANCADEFKKPAAEVPEEELEEEETSPRSLSKELSFETPDYESESSISTPDHVYHEDDNEKQEGPIELKSEVPKVNTKVDFQPQVLNLRDQLVKVEAPKANMSKLDTSNIPTLDSEGEEEL